MSKSFSHLFIQFDQTDDSFMNEVNGSLFEWAIESLIHPIDLLKTWIHLETKHRCVFLRDTNTRLTQY